MKLSVVRMHNAVLKEGGYAVYIYIFFHLLFFGRNVQSSGRIF